MPEIKYGRKEEPGIVLRQSTDLLVLRLKGGKRPKRLPQPVRAELKGADLVLEYADVAVFLFQLRKSAARQKSLAARKAALQRLPEVHFAGSVLVDDASEEALIYTENIFVKFVDSLSEQECRGVLQSHALKIAHVAPYASNAFLTWAPEGTGQTVFELALSLLNRPDVEFCHPEVVREREPKRIFPRQWNLKRAKVGRRTMNASANIAAAHRVTTGEGITIAVIDDGVDIDHPEFAIEGKIVAPRDILSVRAIGIRTLRTTTAPVARAWPAPPGSTALPAWRRALVSCRSGFRPTSSRSRRDWRYGTRRATAPM